MFSTLLFVAAVTYAHPEHLLDTAWLAAHLNDAEVRIVDVRRSGFEGGHIPHASWLDPESIRDTANPPTYLLTANRFEETMARLGISNTTRVVLYDDRGGLLASHLWWMLNAYGHSNVALLNGGWTRWTIEGRPTATESTLAAVAVFKATLNKAWVATLEDVQAAIGKSGKRILDARTVAEMDGSDTRLSSRGGIIPSARAVYWEDLLDPVAKTFKSAEELQAIFHAVDTHPSDEVIAYCWVGHRSAVDLFALHLIGYDHLRNYLGSWEEWSKRADLPTVPYRIGQPVR